MHYSVSGDVTIHEGAAIAPGVLLLADPNSRIVIHAHACIGTGTILHAHDGTLEIGEGSVLGVGVLLVGALHIGDRACIGSATTIFNCSIKKGAIVASGSLLGVDSTVASCGCEVATDDDEVFAPGFCPPPPPVEASKESETPEPTSKSTESSPEPTNQPSEPTPEDSDEIESPPSPPEPTRNGTVYGQMYVNQLLVKLFPHQQRLNGSSDPQNDPSADEG
jgi:carbon dioxide concentrating mechanism protein CcmN